MKYLTLDEVAKGHHKAEEELRQLRRDKELLDWLEEHAPDSRRKWELQTEADYPYVKGCVFLSKSSSHGHNTAREAIAAHMEEAKRDS